MLENTNEVVEVIDGAEVIAHEETPQITVFDVLVGIQQQGIEVILEGDQIKVRLADELLEIVPDGVAQTLEHLQAVMIIARHLGMEFKPEVLAAAEAHVAAQEALKDVQG